MAQHDPGRNERGGVALYAGTVATLLVLIGLYGWAYFSLREVTRYMVSFHVPAGTPVSFVDVRYSRAGTTLEPWCQRIFAPAERLDRWLHPDRFEPM